MEMLEDTLRFFPRLILVVGAPGAGKGTLCKRLSLASGLFHLSVGDLLRRKEKDLREDPIIHTHLERHRLLPGDFLVSMLFKEIESTAKDRNGVIIDGFPRSPEQLRAFQNQNSAKLLILFFDCPKDLARQRFLNRKYPDRPEDNEELFEKRFKEFEENNADILDILSNDHRHIVAKISTAKSEEESWRGLVTQLRILNTKLSSIA